MPTSLISNVDRGELLINVELPPGAVLSDTEKACNQLNEIVAKHGEVRTVVASHRHAYLLGASSARQSGRSKQSCIYVTLKPKDQRKVSQQDFEEILRNEIQDCTGRAPDLFEIFWNDRKAVRIALTSNDSKELEHTGRSAIDQMRPVKGLSDDLQRLFARPEILVKPDFERAARQGVSVMSIARTALIATLRRLRRQPRQVRLEGQASKHSRVQLDPRYRNDMATIGNTEGSKELTDACLPLNSVASAEFGSGPAQIDRS